MPFRGGGGFTSTAAKYGHIASCEIDVNGRTDITNESVNVVINHMHRYPLNFHNALNQLLAEVFSNELKTSLDTNYLRHEMLHHRLTISTSFLRLSRSSFLPFFPAACFRRLSSMPACLSVPSTMLLLAATFCNTHAYNQSIYHHASLTAWVYSDSRCVAVGVLSLIHI